MTKEIEQQELDTAELEQDNIEENIAEEEGKDTQTSADSSEDTRTFTQEELNEIVAKRLERERRKFEDYEDVKKKAKEYEKAVKKAEREKMSEVERLQADLEERDRAFEEMKEAAEQARQEAEKLRIRTAFEVQARKEGIKYVEDAYKLAVLEYGDRISVEEDEVVGLEEVIKELAAEKPFLLSPAKPIGQPMASTKEIPKRTAEDELREAKEKAKSGTPEDKIAYMKLRRAYENSK